MLADTLCATAALLPLLHFETTEIRLDTLHEDDTAVVIHFPFTLQAPSASSAMTATGNQPECRSITLATPWTSCPCTRPYDYPQTPLHIGDSGNICVRFHPAGQSGEILRTISIYCQEEPETPLEELFISAYVLPPHDPFYHYPIRHDPLRLMQDRISLDPFHTRATLLLANIHTTDTLRVYADALPEGIAAPTEEAPVNIPPGSAASLPVSFSGPADFISAPRVETLWLHWHVAEQDSLQQDSVAGKCPIELLVGPHRLQQSR